MIVWSHFLHQKRFRHQLRAVLPHCPTSPNAYDPTDVALGYLGGILCGADKLSRVAWLQSDPASSQVLGVEAIASQSTFSRFYGAFSQRACNTLNRLHRQAVFILPSLPEGYTPDLDSWALLHEDGHQQGVRSPAQWRAHDPTRRPQAEVQALRDKCEALADNAGRCRGWFTPCGALVAVGVMKGGG